MQGTSSVLLEPGEGVRVKYHRGRAIIVYKGFGVRMGEPVDPDGAYALNVSGQSQLLYLDPDPRRTVLPG